MLWFQVKFYFKYLFHHFTPYLIDSINILNNRDFVRFCSTIRYYAGKGLFQFSTHEKSYSTVVFYKAEPQTFEKSNKIAHTYTHTYLEYLEIFIEKHTQINWGLQKFYR